MDPFSITSSVLRITGSCVGAAHTLWEIRNAWKRAPVTVSTLESQLKLTAASLSQIQSLLLGDTDVLQKKPDLVDTFDTTLTSCLVLSSWLEKYMLKIKKGALEGNKTTWKVKFKMVWKESDVKELLEQLHTQQTAISVLVNLLQVDSISEIRKLVRDHHVLLQEIANNTRCARTHAPNARASILVANHAEKSIFSQFIDAKEAEETALESVILNSKVYSKALTGVLKPNAKDDESDDANTIVGTEPASSAGTLVELEKDRLESSARNHRLAMDNAAIISSIENPGVAKIGTKTANWAEIFHQWDKDLELAKERFDTRNHRLAMDDPAIRSSIENLRVARIEAYCLIDSIARSDEELNLKDSDRVKDLKKLTNFQYYATLEGSSGIQGRFDRTLVLVRLLLHSPLQIRTVNFSRKPLDDQTLIHGKGQTLFITEIWHSARWAAQLHKDHRSRKKHLESVFVCDVELEEATEKAVDQLLEFFSCPMPALVSLSRFEQRLRMREIVQRDAVDDKLLALLAHCSTFKELQFVASERKKWLQTKTA